MATLKSPRPTPKFFSELQTFSTKKSRTTPRDQCPPRPPVKSAPPISRIFSKPYTQRAQAVSFKGSNLSLYNRHYQEGTKELYFEQCFEIESKLGAGSFGEVYKVRSKVDGRHYAVKRSRERFRGQFDRQRKLEEVKKHEELPKHENCIRFVKAWEERQHLYIQTELCTTSLSNYSETNHDIQENIIWKFLVDLLLAVKHLHDHDLLHLDIKPDNIFVSSDGICKLGDFGLVLDLKKGDFSEALEGDPKYLAPELLEGKFTKAADIFSLGITILELSCDLDLPRGGEGWQQLRRGTFPDEICARLSPLLRQVIQEMMEPVFTKRPTAKEVLSMLQVQKVLKKRVWELRLKHLFSILLNALTCLWSWSLSTSRFLLQPMTWLVRKLIGPTHRTTVAGTPLLNLSRSKNQGLDWDHSFSDDEVFDEDLLNSSHTSTIPNLSGLSEASTSEENRQDSFFLPNFRSRLRNSTPAMVKNRQGTKKLFTPKDSDNSEIRTETSTPNLQTSFSPSIIVSHDKKQSEEELLKPRNLMNVFNSADSDQDD